MKELMKTVFADKTIWKEHDDTLVLNIAPQGIPPSAEHIMCLQAYGYACCLYVVIEEALPPPLSVILAYPLLSPRWDSDVVFNPLVIQLFVPKKFEALNRWPSKADFAAQINDAALKELTLQYFNMMPVDIAAMSDDQFSSFSINFTLLDSLQWSHFLSQLRLGETFGVSLRGLLLRLAAGRVTSPDDVIRRLHWTSSGSPELEAIESLYIAAFTHYLKGCGRVCHPLLPPEELTKNEKDIAPDDPLAQSILFLMHISGTPLLLAGNEEIEMTFHRKFSGVEVDSVSTSPRENPKHWLDHSCLNGTDLPLLGAKELLKQPIPDDTTTATDFDVYQYTNYRPMTRYTEFGGVISKGASYSPRPPGVCLTYACLPLLSPTPIPMMRSGPDFARMDTLSNINGSSGNPAPERANTDFLNPATMPNWAPYQKLDTLSPLNVSSGHSAVERANTDFLNPATMPNWAPHQKSV
ncbi:hypothetical protein DFH08DRAFT_969185 [Mycena albidolilacea]|uniref:Uncharacterized protein n=1 Tax=Mycena albidolilacea TaxID=1033008 RepID=A0AAD7EIG9_9AGAR|nr:hypothetical protein DFH08DRAFT_969185 [Mycena albidolilacea]